MKSSIINRGSRLAALITGSVLSPFFASAVDGAEEAAAFTLANGLRAKVVSVRGEPRVAVILAVRAGFFAEPPGKAHLAHVTEHLTVFDLPSTAEAATVARWFRERKANGETLPDFMYFDLLVGRDELPQALKVQAARLAATAFSPATLAREIPRTLAEVDFVERAKIGGPAKFAFSAFAQAALHGRRQTPLRAGTRQLTVEDVRGFHTANFRPDGAMLLVVGDCDVSATRTAVEQVFGSILKPDIPPPTRPAVLPGSFDAAWDIKTTHLFLGWPAPPPTEPDHAALTIAAQYLTAQLAGDSELRRRARDPWVTNEIEDCFAIQVQVDDEANLPFVEERLRAQVARLASADGFADAKVLGARQALQYRLAPPAPVGWLLGQGASSPLQRANVELQRVRMEIVWGDLAAYVKRAEALDGPAVRQAIARWLSGPSACVVRLRPIQRTLDAGGARR